MPFHPENYKPNIIIETTRKCNYRCKMCFWSDPETAEKLSRNDETMPMALFEQILETAIQYCAKLSLASSGEFLTDSFLDKRLNLLSQKLKQFPHIRFYPITNGALLNKDKLKFLKGVNKAGFTISIDTVDPLIYATIRKPGSLPRVIENIRNLRRDLSDLGIDDVRITLNVVMLKRNVFTIPEILYFARETRASLFVDHPQGFGPHEFLEKESLFTVPVFANTILERCDQLARELCVPFNRPPSFAITNQEISAYYQAKKSKVLSCPQLDETGPIRILANGDVTPCCQHLVFGNLYEQPFEDIFFSENYTKYRSAIAEGKPLQPCDQCRWLYRTSPYLYESQDYGLNIPPNRRNMSPFPDLKTNGFLDWLGELSEKQLVSQLERHYEYNANFTYSEKISQKIIESKQLKQLNEHLKYMLANRKKVIIYPADKLTEWLLDNTFLSEVSIIGFSDDNRDMIGKKFRGFIVIPPAKIKTLKPDILFIATEIYKKQFYEKFKHLEKAQIEVLLL